MKKNVNIQKEISEALQKAGAKAAFLSINDFAGIQGKYLRIIDSRPYSSRFYDSYLKRFRKDYREIFPEAKSIIVVVYPQPVTEVNFNLKGKIIKTIIPPTYVYRKQEVKIKSLLNKILSRGGYKITETQLPDKFTTVVSGLGKYGKNNLCYVEGMGSFNTPLIFLSDLPFEMDMPEKTMPAVKDLPLEKTGLHDFPAPLKICGHCTKCTDNCPTGAITAGSFIINPEKCITYFNENEFKIPGWVLPKWQNTLVGCMCCQDICPVNKKVLKNKVKGPDFSELETDAILKKTEFAKLPQATKNKINSLCMENYYPILSRNLKMLVNL